MKINNIPYPRLAIKQYLLIAFSIAFVVSFILIVFQPFGTAKFHHPNKNLILAGYGFCVFATTSIFYFLSIQVVHKNRENRWTILWEGLDLFLVTLLSFIACYIYSVEIFNRSYNLNGLLYFISIAASVAILPVLGCLGFLYVNWKDVKRAEIQHTEEEQPQTQLILILGNNKNDQIKVTPEEIILAQAQNNYVMLYLQKTEKIQRHIIRTTMKQIKAQLNEKIFLQAHRSYIVNKENFGQLHGNKSKASLEIIGLDKKIPISRSFYDFLKTEAN